MPCHGESGLDRRTCLFPTRNHDPNEPSDRKALNIGTSPAKQLMKYCAVHGLDVNIALVATWAMILQQFVDGHAMIMGMEQIGSTKDLDSSRDLGLKQDMKVVMSEMDGNLGVKELFEEDQWVQISAPPSSFNTGVILSRDAWRSSPLGRREEEKDVGDLQS